jgi:hypothetical protein
MIFFAQLGIYGRKALKSQALQSNVSRIAELVVLDPKISHMDAVVLCPKDIGGILGRHLLEAIEKRNQNVGIIYLYQSEKDANLINGDIYKKLVRKYTPEAVTDAVSAVLEPTKITHKDTVVESQDRKTPPSSFPKFPLRRGNKEKEEAAAAVEEKEEIVPVVEEAVKAEPVIEVSKLDVPELSESVDIEELTRPPEKKYTTLEERIRQCTDFPNYDLFKRALEKDVFVRELMNENTRYAGVVEMLNVLDKQIYSIFRDENKSSEKKFSEIQSIGLQRAAYAATKNDIVVEKVSNIIVAIVESVKQATDVRIESVRKSLDTVVSSQLSFKNRDRLAAIVEERLTIQTYLLEMLQDIINVYKTIDNTVNDIVLNMDSELPSSNDYVNTILKPVTMSGLFQPRNIQDLASKMMRDLQEHRIAMSLLEEKIRSVIDLVFKLCDADNTIIDYQQKWIELLKAQRVEDVVIVDTVIKKALRIFIGPSDVGRTATALTWCGILARRHNTLLIDLSGSSKFSDYGVEPLNLEDFLNERIQRDFLILKGEVSDLERLREIIAELKSRLDYYAHINIILDVSQTEILNELAESALTVHFISDGTPRSIAQVRNCITGFTTENVARKIIVIDPPVDPLTMLSEMTADPLTTKLIPIPYIKFIRACALNKTKPYDNKEVIEVFEEAFR